MTNGYTIAAALRAEAATVGPTDPTRAKKLNEAADLHERAAEQRGDPR